MADESKTGILGHLPPLPRPALNNSVIGMEQAYRQRKGLQLLTDADIEALKAGQPMPWEVGGVAPPLPRALRLRLRRRLRPSFCASGSGCGGGNHQRGSCQVGRARKQVEQVDDRRRTGATRPQGFARAE